MKWAAKRHAGFTIVELLIVVVVIAILAAITIIAFNGIQQRSKQSSLQSSLSQIAKKIEATKAGSSTEVYPASLADAGISNPPSGTTYSASAANKGYCLVIADGANSYYMTQLVNKPTVGSCVTASGLLGWWPFNGSTVDASGNGNDGVGTNITPISGQNGEQNGAYSFNGTSSVIRCGDGTPQLLKADTAVTVSSWVNVLAGSSSMSGIFNYGTGGYWLTLTTALRPSFYVTTSNGVANNYGAPSGINTGQWYHIAATYTSGSRMVYVNGAMVATESTASGSLTNYNADECQIGSVKYTSGRYFNGSIDDVRVYNRALSGSEIQALYTAGAL